MLYCLKIKLTQNAAIRAMGIAGLNLLFYSKNIKTWFEKHIFNPYEIDGNESADYAVVQSGVILDHLNISNKKILEIGPGGSYYLACILLKKGAEKVFVIDNENHHFFPEKELDIYRKIYPQSLKNNTINPEKIAIIHYDKEGAIPLSPDSIDIIYSNAVFEHVFEPKELLIDCQKILTNTGHMLHQIDFRDHIFNQKSLFFLKIPNLFFDILFKNTGMWINRLRYSDWKKLFSSLKQTKIIFCYKQYGEIILSEKQKLHTSEDMQVTSMLIMLEKYAK